jgi:hypothetical protein
LIHVGRAWKYQSGNQNPSIEEGQTTQWPKEEGQTTQWPKEEGQTTQWPKEKGQQKDKQRSTNHYTLRLKIEYFLTVIRNEAISLN